MKKYLIALLSLCSCGSETNGDFVVKNITVYSDVGELNQEEFKSAIENTYQGFEDTGIGTKRINKFDSKYLSIYIRKDLIHCAGAKSGLCYGVCYGCCEIEVFQNDPCMGKTALVHELVHWVLYWKAMDEDADHNDPRFYGPDSITANANSAIQEEFCAE